MLYSFAPEAHRRVSAANVNLYSEAAPHPDRVMFEHDFVYILEGTWGIAQENERFFLHADDVLLLPAGFHHFGVKNCLPGTRTMYIHTPPAQEDAQGNGILLPTVVHCSEHPRIKMLFEDILSAHWTDAPHREAELSALLNLLLLSLAKAQTLSAPEARDLTTQITHLILLKPERNLSLQELSSLLHVSVKTLQRAVQKQTGLSVHQYQLSAKLEMLSEQLWLFPERPLRELAQSFGFCDEFHLSRRFKEKYGLSPREWRKQAVISAL